MGLVLLFLFVDGSKQTTVELMQLSGRTSGVSRLQTSNLANDLEKSHSSFLNNVNMYFTVMPRNYQVGELFYDQMFKISEWII